MRQFERLDRDTVCSATTANDLESGLRFLCRQFFKSIGAKVIDRGKLLQIMLPEGSPFEWDSEELIVVFEKDVCEAVQGALLFSPGSQLFHRVHEWLKSAALHIAIELPEVEKPTEPNLRFGNCKLISVKRRRAKLRGLLVSLSLSCTPAYEKGALKSFMVLENGFVEDVTHRVDRILFDAKPAKPSYNRSLLRKLLELLKERHESLLSDWLSGLTKTARERSKAELMRIASYYSSLFGEAAIKAGNSRQFWHEMERLIDERNERMEEEAQRRQPFVSIHVVGIAEISVPVAEFKFTVAQDSHQLSFKAYHNLYDSTFALPTCASCASQMSLVNLCACKHTVCSDCILECSTCGRAYCRGCIEGFCEICNLPVCKECFMVCEICGKRICEPHSAKCEFCGRGICKMCSAECYICGKIVCANDAIICTVCDKAICNDCLQQNSERIHRCSTCGKSVCAEDGSVCSTCGQIICAKCRNVCSICGSNICTMHAFRANCCSTTLCSEHVVYCQSCAKIVCPKHVTQCGICGATVCHLCSSKCILCEQRYCFSCLKGKTMCSLCINLLKSLERKLPPSLLPQPMPKHDLKGKNCRFIATQYRAIYLWRDGMNGLLVVADGSGKTILTKQLSMLWLLRHLKKWS